MSGSLSVLVPIELDRPRTMRFDFDAFCTYEDVTGESLFKSPPASAKGFRAILFAVLKHEDATLTLEQVGKLVHMGNIQHVMAQIEKGISDAMPKAEASGSVPLGGTRKS